MSERGGWPAPTGDPLTAAPVDPATAEIGPADWWQGAETAGESTDGPPPGGSRATSGTIALAVVAGLVAGLIGGAGASALMNRDDSAGTASVIEIPQTSGERGELKPGSVAAIAEATLPAVVSIEIPGKSSGSGFILRSDGYIVTNNHVVADAADGGKFDVKFNDGTTVPGKIVGRSASYDLAVVRVDRKKLKAARLGNSSAVRVGDSVIAIGSPLGLNGTVTTGIISAVNRPVTTGGSGDQSFISAVQTDAAINPGNSGGPLLDAEGKVIGVNTAIATVAQTKLQAGSIGLGFAIPINQAKRIAEEIIATGKSETPIIGVWLDTGYQGPGAKVRSVTAGGPASSTDLKKGDVITAVDGHPVADAMELVVAIRSHAPGDKVVLTIKDKGDVTITLGVSDD